MKRARFSDEQIVRILQEADRNPTLSFFQNPNDLGLCKS
jgi:hypothetical protein